MYFKMIKTDVSRPRRIQYFSIRICLTPPGEFLKYATAHTYKYIHYTMYIQQYVLMYAHNKYNTV